jgi:hypothetical protein
MGKIGQIYLKWVILVKKTILDISGQFYPPIAVGKKITDSNGFKKTHPENG